MHHHSKPKKAKTAEDVVHHFKMRCFQRLGIFIDIETLKSRMLKHDLPVVWSESNSKTHFQIPADMLPKGFNREVVAVYDKARHEFVTVLFKDGRY